MLFTSLLKWAILLVWILNKWHCELQYCTLYLNPVSNPVSYYLKVLLHVANLSQIGQNLDQLSNPQRTRRRVMVLSCVCVLWVYTLLTAFIQLDGHTYWLHDNIWRFSTHRFLYNHFQKLQQFSLVFGCLALTVYLLIAHAHALTRCTHDNPVCAVPTQKCNGSTVRIR